MRVKAGDPALKHKLVKAYLDGKEISSICFEADDEEGWADCYELDEKGNKILVTIKGVEQAKKIRFHGKVQIAIIDAKETP